MQTYDVHPGLHMLRNTLSVPQEYVIVIEKDGFFLNHNFMHNVTDLDAPQPDCSPLNPNSTFRLVYF